MSKLLILRLLYKFFSGNLIFRLLHEPLFEQLIGFEFNNELHLLFSCFLLKIITKIKHFLIVRFVHDYLTLHADQFTHML